MNTLVWRSRTKQVQLQGGVWLNLLAMYEFMWLQRANKAWECWRTEWAALMNKISSEFQLWFLWRLHHFTPEIIRKIKIKIYYLLRIIWFSLCTNSHLQIFQNSSWFFLPKRSHKSLSFLISEHMKMLTVTDHCSLDDKTTHINISHVKKLNF